MKNEMTVDPRHLFKVYDPAKVQACLAIVESWWPKSDS